MSLIEAFILGLVQGITEFFPISSSTHLQCARWLLGIEAEENLRYFDLICHGGTMLAALVYLRKDFLEICTSFQKMALLFLALLPLVPAYLLIKSANLGALPPAFLGSGLLFTALLLAFASRKKNTLPNEKWKWQDVVCIGMMQTLALLPGISRSGSTIAAARFRGWSWAEAARFSFLLAIPSVFGGQVLETVRLFQKSSSGEALLPSSCYLVGFLGAFVFGLAGIHGVFRMYRSLRILPFICYCAAIGLLLLVNSYA